MITKNSKLVGKLINLDKRIVYLFIILAVSIPFFLKPVVKIKTTPWVEKTYNLVEEAAKLGKPLIISFDYDPSTLAELQPMAKAILRHAFSKNVKVLGINFIINGTSLAASTMDEVAKEYDKKNGVDYVFLGFVPQYQMALISFGEDFRKIYNKDFRGIDIKDIPMLNNLQNYGDFHAVFDLTGTKMVQGFILYGVEKFKFKLVAGVTAVSATEYYPYLQTGQMQGLLVGMKGAAEYEGISGFLDQGMAGMASQTWGHVAIILFIIIGNILFFVKRRMDRQE